MYIIGIVLALLIGIILGLVGGGGSILTVPMFHYFFGETMLMSTTYSLFIVAIASSFGVLQRLPKKQVDFHKGIIFVIPSMLTALSIRLWIMPLFPISFSVNSFELSRDVAITILLIAVMIFTAIQTLKKKSEKALQQTTTFEIAMFGILTGFLSGFIGAGGGFIIVPILLRMGLDMKKAVGTSMFIIAIQSFVAVIGDFFNEEITRGSGIDWELLIHITIITVIGVLIGTLLQKRFSMERLRKIFSFLLLAVAAGLMYKLLSN